MLRHAPRRPSAIHANPPTPKSDFTSTPTPSPSSLSSLPIPSSPSLPPPNPIPIQASTFAGGAYIEYLTQLQHQAALAAALPPGFSVPPGGVIAPEYLPTATVIWPAPFATNREPFPRPFASPHSPRPTLRNASPKALPLFHLPSPSTGLLPCVSLPRKHYPTVSIRGGDEPHS